MNLADDDHASPDLPGAGASLDRAAAGSPARSGVRTGMGGSLIDWLWLRRAERWARRLPEGERQVLFAQVTRARQKLESARLLWAHEQYVEGLRLAEESVGEALRAAEQAAPILPPGGAEHVRPAARPVWADVLATLGAGNAEVDEAASVAGGFVGSRPSWNGDLRGENRRYFRSAIRTSETALERLSPLVMAPRRIVVARWLRVAAVVGVGLAIAATTLSVRNAVDVRASASFNELQYDPRKAVDGKPDTEWLLPSYNNGWFEVGFRPRTIKMVKLLNARNAPYFDRATKDFRLEGYLDKKLVHTSKHSFAKFEENPPWMNLPLPPMRLDTLRIVIESLHKTGGGIAELAYE